MRQARRHDHAFFDLVIFVTIVHSYLPCLQSHRENRKGYHLFVSHQTSSHRFSSKRSTLSILCFPHLRPITFRRSDSNHDLVSKSHKSLYPKTLLSNLRSATAQHHALPASPPNSDSGDDDFSSMPSFSIDLISWPVVYVRKCSKCLSSRARALPEMPAHIIRYCKGRRGGVWGCVWTYRDRYTVPLSRVRVPIRILVPSQSPSRSSPSKPGNTP